MSTEKNTAEDLTFEALQKSPIERMIIQWEKWSSEINFVETLHFGWPERREAFCKQHGWTWNRFFEERKNWLNHVDNMHKYR